MKTFKNGHDGYHAGENRNSKNGVQWLKGWDNAKFGRRLNGTLPKNDSARRYSGPQNLARSVDLGYAQ